MDCESRHCVMHSGHLLLCSPMIQVHRGVLWAAGAQRRRGRIGSWDLCDACSHTGLCHHLLLPALPPPPFPHPVPVLFLVPIPLLITILQHKPLAVLLGRSRPPRLCTSMHRRRPVPSAHVSAPQTRHILLQPGVAHYACRADGHAAARGEKGGLETLRGARLAVAGAAAGGEGVGVAHLWCR